MSPRGSVFPTLKYLVSASDYDNFEYEANIYALPDGDDGVSRARSAARAYRSWSSIISVIGCAPPNTRRAVRLGEYRPGARLQGLELGNPR